MTTLYALLLSVASGLAPATAEVPKMVDAQAQYLSDLCAERLISHSQGFGELGLDTTATVPGRPPLPLSIHHRVYPKGLGHHAPGEIVVALDGLYAAFEAEVGLLWDMGTTGSVVFQVWVDDRLAFGSGVMREADEARPVRVDVTGAEVLRLVVTDAGDGMTCDVANWAMARLTPDPAAQARPQEPPVDIAPFGQVVTFDPARRDGARSGRLEPFAPEDVYLHTPLAPGPDGACQVPLAADGTGCIGLQWAERRVLREVGLELAPGETPPPGARLEYWSSQGRQDSWDGIGQTLWQGEWVAVDAPVRVEDRTLTVALPASIPELRDGAGVHKVRWLFPGLGRELRVAALHAFTRSRWATREFRVECQRTTPGLTAHIEAYNGLLLMPAGEERTRTEVSLAAPVRLPVRMCRPPWGKSDRTVLRFRMRPSLAHPLGEFSIALEDALRTGGVYVPEAGLYLGPGDGDGLAAYRAAHRGQQTTLDRVRALPDQTLDSARAALHDPLQDHDPLLLSLACDNRKFVTTRDGSVRPVHTNPEATDYLPDPCSLQVTLGRQSGAPRTRRLDGGWLPRPLIELDDDGVQYRQRTFVAPGDPTAGAVAPWCQTTATCVVEVTALNTSAAPRVARWSAGLRDDQAGPLAVQVVDGRALALKPDGSVFAALGDAAELQVAPGEVLGIANLAAGEARSWLIWLPGDTLAPADVAAAAPAPQSAATAFEAYWRAVLDAATTIKVPDPLLDDLISASRVHCLIAARSVAGGAQIAAWCGADRYGPLDTEAHAPIRGMDLLGHSEFARRSLEYFVDRMSPGGYLARGYTLIGTGQHLWTLGEHWALARDDDWLRGVAPRVEGACRWITTEREKTRRATPDGDLEPESGLLPPGVLADWNRYAHYFYGNGWYYAGLHAAALALQATGAPEGADLVSAAADFRADIRRAFRWNQARMPVVPLADGSWVPPAASSLYCFGLTGDFYSGVSSIGHDVEAGGNHLTLHGVLDPAEPDYRWVTDFQEDHWFFIPGLAAYPEDRMREDWFDFGGFSKLQQYYTRNAQLYALRDDLKPYVRAYMNSFWPLLSLETMALWEHYHNVGGWNKTHETGWFLEQTRTMLLQERGDELWIAPFVTSEWLREGLEVTVERAPSRFGPVSYVLTSHVATGYLEARLRLPRRQAPAAVVVRLRHPEGKPMEGALVNGVPVDTFDPAAETVRFTPAGPEATIRAQF